MKKFLNNIKVEAGHIRMSAAEKSAMHSAIFGLPSPTMVRQSPYLFMSYHVRMSIAGLLVFVLAGSGTVSAAQGALPGDILYSVKISVNEKVEVALAPTSAAKAQVQERLAERRVEEAQELSVRGRLDSKTAETLTIDFDKHAARALAFAEDDEDEFEDVSDDGQVSLSAERATTAPRQESHPVKKSSGHHDELKESLRAKAEELKEIKIRSQRQEIRGGGREEEEEEEDK